MSEIRNLNKYINPNHKDIFESQAPELIVYGGAGAGKSFSIADKLLFQSIWQSDRKIKIVVIRKTFPSLRNTTLNIIEDRAETFGFPFKINKAEWNARCGNLHFVFQSLNNKEDYDKLKSLTDVDFIWINEVHEIREADYDECLRRLRGGKSEYEQIIVDFNPVGKTSWVYKRFFQKNIGDTEKLKYTVLDNHPDYLSTAKAQRYVERLRRTKEHNLNYYKIYFLGEWGELKGVIYNWDIVPLPNDVAFDSIFYGGDFGYSIDPASLTRIYRKSDEYWLQEIIYETGLTNIQLGKVMRRKGVKSNEISYWDSAEPKSIQELSNLGIAARPAIKGPDSVKAGIDYIQEQKVHIVEGSENISNEQKAYVWKEDKDGNPLNKPIEFNNHAMDGIRYGIYTNAKRSGLMLYTGEMYEEAKQKREVIIKKSLARVNDMQTVGCTLEEYTDCVRDALLERSAEIEGDKARFIINEVSRLDRALGYEDLEGVV